MAAQYDFAEQFEGNSLEKRVMAIKRYEGDVLTQLTGAEIAFEVFREDSTKIYLSKTTANGGIEILDAELCIFRINEVQNPGLTPYKYNYRIKITYADGDVKTYVHGKLPIVKFKKRKYAGHDCN